MKNKYIKYLIPALILLGLLYWFQVRPANIRSKCAREISGFSYVGIGVSDKNFTYENCIHRYGLK